MESKKTLESINVLIASAEEHLALLKRLRSDLTPEEISSVMYTHQRFITRPAGRFRFRG